MAFLDNIVAQLGIAGAATGGGLIGFKLLADGLREWAANRRADQVESQALKTMREQMDRLTRRVEELEKDVAERDQEAARLNALLDEQRKLRRQAEDALDIAQRAQRDLERRVQELERKQ